MTAPSSFDTPAVIELRRYTLHPGQRDVLIDLFEREFIEPQEAAGMRVLGTFRDLDDPDRFIWLRGFADMATRAQGLGDFYFGPVWQRHRAAANATIVDSDDVLLLRPATVADSFARALSPRAPVGAPAPGRAGLFTVTTCALCEAPTPALVETFERLVRPAWTDAGGELLACLVTETSAN